MTRTLTYYVGGRRRRLPLQGLFEAPQVRAADVRGVAFERQPQRMGAAIAASLAAVPRVGDLFEDPAPEARLIVPTDRGRTTVIPTAAVVVEGATREVVRDLRRDAGLELVREGRQDKVLLRVPGPTDEAVFVAAEVSRAVVESGQAPAAYLDFIRVLQRPGRSAAAAATQWNLDNGGSVGLVGADVHAPAAWTITEGDPEVRVAVLDEGVDTGHPMLAPAVVAEADFVDGNAGAAPSGDDAHGTACAGIVCSRDEALRGVAPGVSLVAARIAKSDDQGFWVFDDFETADAIDWAWQDAEAHVLSSSWGGGAASDAITLAVGRARSRGRGGKGAVVVFAAGNTQQRIGFPATVDGVLTVGASNQWDERKTKRSKDGEAHWGSNTGPELDVMAPGVSIRTTDMAGGAGYDAGDVTGTFNGTSSATPHVAGALGLVLSVNPGLTEARARAVVTRTADPIGRSRVPNHDVGHGRLNCYAAVRLARRG